MILKPIVRSGIMFYQHEGQGHLANAAFPVLGVVVVAAGAAAVVEKTALVKLVFRMSSDHYRPAAVMQRSGAKRS